LRIPAVTIVTQPNQPTYFLRQSPDDLSVALAQGDVPLELLAAGAIGVDQKTLRHLIASRPEGFPLSILLAQSVRAARLEGRPAVETFSPLCVVSVTGEDLETFRPPVLARELASALAWEASHV
jgi:hypothetical protein